MIAALLALALALPVPQEAPASPAATAAPADCPPPKTVLPRYPVDDLRAGRRATVLVGARFDDCGRVLETRVDGRTGRGKGFAAAARASVQASVLDPAKRASAVDGWAQVEVRFGGVRTVTDVRDIPWPESHRRPRYLADDQPLPVASIAGFRAAAITDESGVMRSPYASATDPAGRRISTTLRPERADPSIFWLSYDLQPVPSPDAAAPSGGVQTLAVARYRLVKEAGQPVVRLGLLCERPAAECETLREFLFQGLPFARPPG